MTQVTEESRPNPELERTVLTGLTVSLTLRNYTQILVLTRTTAETLLQMRMPKLFGASLKEVLLFTIGSIVIPLEAEKTKEQSRKKL
jgi:nitrogen fixation/metabolism regulation signal transduction histidine kinase